MRNPKQQKRAPIGAQFKAKKIITTRENGSLRVQKDFSDCVSKTKLEFQKECDIHNIVKFPLPPQAPLAYSDLSNVPNLRDVFKTVHDVKENFMKIPSDVRKLMDNDPSKLKMFIEDPKNKELLLAKGVLKAPESAKPLPNKKIDTSSKEVLETAPAS